MMRTDINRALRRDLVELRRLVNRSMWHLGERFIDYDAIRTCVASIVSARPALQSWLDEFDARNAGGTMSDSPCRCPAEGQPCWLTHDQCRERSQAIKGGTFVP